MSRYDRSYDYGLRGAPPQPRWRPERVEGSRRGEGYQRPDGYSRPPMKRFRYEAEFERRMDPRARMARRVTMPYTADYVYGGRGERYPFNPTPYGAPHPGMISEPGAYRRPYMTEGGTRTWRGAMPPQRYDVPDYGPDYGGRYPDEL